MSNKFWKRKRCYNFEASQDVRDNCFLFVFCLLVFPIQLGFPKMCWKSAEWDAVTTDARMPTTPASSFSNTSHPPKHWDLSQFLEAELWLRTHWSLFLNFKMKPQTARGTFGTLAVIRKEKAMVCFLRRRCSIFRWVICRGEKHSKSWSKVVIFDQFATDWPTNWPKKNQ